MGIKNDYSIKDGAAFIHVTRKNGDKFDVIIDEEDLEIIDELDFKVHVSWHRDNQQYYAEICQYLGIIEGKPRYKTLLIHRLVTKAHKGTHVDHKNHDSLDNRKDNLRVTEANKNLKHRKTKNTNNKSGYRNVCWEKNVKMWMVQLQIDGKNTRLGYFDDVHEAGRYAEKMRNTYYGDFKGKE
ncbi:HNH endonuclease [Paenibacillus tianjinensis]|uniref:HNH nuclease domain-containing protein n=1 Tax=Paenibacillus tianjinensis TaxID=2810347 RepID=A0ABX7L840_9BACL|nr:hypothetical protein [Paenibacillus tianjinensis]QSF43426.1 hypothetical protein JRJ22_19370 [Paenibacillus tianjinensis]